MHKVAYVEREREREMGGGFSVLGWREGKEIKRVGGAWSNFEARGDFVCVSP